VYTARGDDGSLRSFPGIECGACGRTQPDDEAIEGSERVPHGLRERCEEVRSESRIRVAARQ
jgi:hypothetical protein